MSVIFKIRGSAKSNRLIKMNSSQSILSQTLVVLPAYNEAEALPTVLAELASHVELVNVLVVDDGSSDDTADIAEKFGVDVLRLPFNLGVGGAMRAGFKYALVEEYKNVVQLDADGQHDPSDISKLVANLEHADLVIGARFAGVGEYKVKGFRAFAMKVLSLTLSKICKQQLTDTTSGFKAIGPRALALFASNYPAEYLGDTVEALVIASRSGCNIVQVPVEMRERIAGVASQSFVKSFVYLVRACLAIFIALIRPIDEVSPKVSK